MSENSRKSPIFPMCKLAEYSVTASSTRRRSLVKTQLKQALGDSEKRRWWYQEGRADIRKFLRTPSTTRQDLTSAANRLRDAASSETKESTKTSFLASARAIESFSPIAEAVRNRQVVASPGRREDAHIHRGNVEVIVSPDLLFLEPGTEHIVGAIKLHAAQEFKLSSEALLNAAAILYTYLQEHGEKPIKKHCTVVDVFTPAFESAPASTKRRMQTIEASCEEIEGWWNAMYDRVQTEVAAKRRGQT